MAPLPYTNTARLLIEYTCLGQEHVAQLRLVSGSLSGDAVSVYNTFAPFIAAFLPDEDAVTGARFAVSGSNLTFPLLVTPETGGQTGAFDPENRPEFISFTGRGGNGRRTRFTLFTPVGDPDTGGYRDNNPSGIAATLLDALEANTPPICAIDGTSVVWNTYHNIGYNSYYQRKLRRSG